MDDSKKEGSGWKRGVDVSTFVCAKVTWDKWVATSEMEKNDRGFEDDVFLKVKNEKSLWTPS
jgi:hypothetical protein